MPTAFDQFDNAHHLMRLGVAARISRKSLTARLAFFLAQNADGPARTCEESVRFWK
jgi:hypothetical protein